MSKVGLVLEGGGLRGIFTAGVVDCLLKNKIKFDYVIGVSAGACNTMAYVGNKYEFFKDCILKTNKKDAFFGVSQMKDSHKIVDLDKVFEEYAIKYKFDFNEFKKNKIEWEMVTTNIRTGKPEYLSEKKDIERIKSIGKASCSLPLITKPVRLDNKLYLDGGIADSIPIERALKQGCDKVVVVCTRRKNKYPHISEPEIPVYKSAYKKYPKFLNTVFEREEKYKETKSLIDKLVEEGKVIDISPTLPEVGRLESDHDKLSLYYYHGYTKTLDKIKEIKSLF